MLTAIWVLSSPIIALALHEAAHYLAAECFGIKVKQVYVSIYGFAIVREPGALFDNLVVTLAGPGINLLLACLCWFNIRSFVEMVQHPFFLANACMFLFNLLPLDGSDGYRAWRCWYQIENHLKGRQV